MGVHRPIEPATLGRGRSKRVRNHVRRDSSLGHFLLELTNAFAGLAADLFERVESGVDHLQQVLTRELAGRGHLGEGERERFHLHRISLGDVADFVEVLFRILQAHPEAQEGLHVAREVLHTKRSLRRFNLQVVNELLGFGLVTQHRRKGRGVLLHTGVVLHARFEGSGHAATDRGDRMPDTLHPGNDGFGGEVGFQHVAENAGLGTGGVHLVTEIIHRALKTSCVLGGVFSIVARTVCLVPEIREGVVVGFEFAFEPVELRACVVELDLPILRPRIILTKRGSAVFECGA